MPEGHTVHREARLQRNHLGGRRLRVASPQGRFADGASVLDGQVLGDIEARGKHLFYEWTDGPLLHIHLGLFGRFRHYGSDAPRPTDGTRLALAANDHTLYLSGPTICELTDDEGREAIVSKLGPDPLRPADEAEAPSRIIRMLSRRKVPVAQALLDQSVIAGLGNVYRSEILFRIGLNPFISARDVIPGDVEALWSEAVKQLRDGESTGKIVTTDPSDVGRETRSKIEPGERTYVYKRAGEPCRRCGSEIQRREVAARKVWWCPSCQRL